MDENPSLRKKLGDFYDVFIVYCGDSEASILSLKMPVVGQSLY